MDFYIIRLLRKSDGKERVTIRFSYREACDVVEHFFAEYLADYCDGGRTEQFSEFICLSGVGEVTIVKKDHPRIIEVETLDDVLSSGLIKACVQKRETYNKSRGAE